MDRAASLTLALFLALAFVAIPFAAAADTAPVLVERVDAGQLAADAGRNATAVFGLTNLNPTTDFYVSVVVDGVRDWAPADVQPNKFLLHARAAGDPVATNVSITFSPIDAPRAEATFHVTFSLVNSATGDVAKIPADVPVASAAPPRVLDALKNPLGAPFDNVWGTFLLDMTFWVALGVVAVFAANWLVRVATMRAAKYVSTEMASKLRLPLFLFIASFGLSGSIGVLPRNFLTEVVARIVVAIGVGIFGLYVLYKLLDAGLYYYEKEIAPKTETKMDDVVIPVVRKVGVVVFWVAAVIVTLKQLGWDPTIIFAGAGIAGLVIAFAAQDTFSNLFSGVFLMLDQPFVEGDDIMLESGETARVERIGLRTTRLYNYMTHESIIVPNNNLATKRIVNHTGPDSKFRLPIEVGVDYASDPEVVKRLLLQVAAAHPKVLKDAPWEPRVRFKSFGDSSLDFTLRVTIPEFKDRNEIGSDLRFAIKKTFEANGIDIPYPHRTLVMKGEAGKVLTPAAPGEARPAKK
ncbi:MAG: MscS family rane protein [Thermoplasmata archaeon]|nr:MscS family rane protein [Thermoplasmata archaeon]